MTTDTITPPRPFMVEELVVYPTREPENKRPVPVPEQTIKLQAIRRLIFGRDER